MDFQAAVTAIIGIYAARGQKLGWLDGLHDDTPTEIKVETGGPGDDIQVRFRDGSIAEIQVKRGLRADGRLWESLEKLAKAVAAGTIQSGIIAVSPDSSRTVAHDLAQDLRRLGDGRTDSLGGLAETFRGKLAAAGLPETAVARKLRIVTVHADDADPASIQAARAELGHICREASRVSDAWDRLYRDAHQMIAYRGARTAATLVHMLRGAGIDIAADAANGTAAIIAGAVDWAKRANTGFSIIGVKKPLCIQNAWLPIKAVVRTDAEPTPGNLAEAVAGYRDWPQRTRNQDRKAIDPETLGWFYRRCVVVGGPGLGKSTLLTRLALEYALDGFPVLKIRLRALAVQMRTQGVSLKDGLFSLGLASSGLSPAAARDAAIADWVILCDGLDECGEMRDRVAEELRAFAVGHPHCRIVVTTRPVGYDTAHLSDWRHYDLVSFNASSIEAHLSMLLREIDPVRFADGSGLLCSLTRRSDDDRIRDVLARSPLLTGLAAAVVASGRQLAESRVQLYRDIFQLIDDLPSDRKPDARPGKAVLKAFLDRLGWELTLQPLSSTNDLLKRCAAFLASTTDRALLAAIETAEHCLTYWEAAGLVERLRFGTDETLAFVHKSFEEYTAARQLADLPEEQRARIVTDRVADPAWWEVMCSAASMGMVEDIARAALEAVDEGDRHAMALIRTLKLLSQAEAKVSEDLAERVFGMSTKTIQSCRQSAQEEIGTHLADLAHLYPETTISTSGGLFDNPDPAMRLVAWACHIKAGIPTNQPAAMFDVLRALPDLLAPKGGKSLTGGLNLDRIRTRWLSPCETVAIHTMSPLAELAVPDEILEKLISGIEPWTDVVFHHHANVALGSAGHTLRFGREKSRFASSYLSSPERMQSRREVYRGTLEALRVDDFEKHGASDRRCLELSHFFKISAFKSLNLFEFEFELLRNIKNDCLASSIVNCAGEMISEDHRQLMMDVDIVLGAINSRPDCSFYEYILSIDAPMDEWKKNRNSDPDKNVLEAALHHQSKWIVYLGGMILDGLVTVEERKALVERLYKDGEGHALWPAAAFARELPPPDGVRLTLNRLRGRLVPECDHLFEALQDLTTEITPDVREAIENGLMTGTARTAKAAATLAGKLAQPGDSDLIAILTKAYAHWQQHEDPYPVEGGEIPDSPRDDILPVLLHLHAPDLADLLIYAQDKRHDVAKSGREALTQRLMSSDAARHAFVGAILDKSAPVRLLPEVLRDKVPFREDNVKRMLPLLADPDPVRRYAAIKLLDPAYLPPAEIERLARGLAEDVEEEIRDAALRILDGIAAEPQ